MSQAISKQLIREYQADTRDITFGAAAQQVNFNLKTEQATSMIEFGIRRMITTVPADDPLTAVWCTSITISVNDKPIVNQMSRAEYIELVQNLEVKEAALIQNGEMFQKWFKPALPSGTKIQITLVLNTLALGTTTPAATAIGRCFARFYDTDPRINPAGKSLTFYVERPRAPQAVGLTLGTDIETDLGTFNRHIKAIIIDSEDPVGTLVSTRFNRAELKANGVAVLSMDEPSMAKAYRLASDGIAQTAGRYAMLAPGGGFNASSASQMSLMIQPRATSATAQFRIWEIYEQVIA